MYLCVDVGGTSTRIALSSDGRTFIAQSKYDTPQDFEGVIELLKRDIKNPSEIKRICFGVAGVVDSTFGKILWNPHRKNWGDTEVFKHLREIFPNADMRIENDANLAALGEAVFGAGSDKKIVSFLTLSTGIGGGLIIDKKIIPSIFGFEPGHHIIGESDVVWTCGQKGCFESFASGTAFKKRFGVAAIDCDDKTIWGEYAVMLARGVNNVIAFWSPEILVLGGGVSQRFEMFEESLKKNLAETVTFGSIPEIRKVALDEPGLYGGLALFT